MSEQSPDAKMASLEGKVELFGERVATGLAHLTQLVGIVQEVQGRQSGKLDSLVQTSHAWPAELGALKAKLEDLDGLPEALSTFKAEAKGSIRTMQWAAGIIGTLLMVLGTMTVYVFNLRMDQQAKDTTRLEQRHNEDTAANRARLDRLDGRGNGTTTGGSQP